jgi:hypothetical protein
LHGYVVDDEGSSPDYVRFGPGVGGAYVELLDAAGVSSGQATATNADGYFQFDVAEGDYIVAFTPPAGRAFSLKSTMEAWEIRRMVPIDPATGRTGVVSIAAGESIEVVTFLEVSDTPRETIASIWSSSNATNLDGLGAVIVGDAVTIIVRVASPGEVLTGEVDITIGASLPVTVPLGYDGVATLSHQFPVGDTTVTVNYLGDAGHEPSASSYVQHVLAKTTATLGYGQGPAGYYGDTTLYVRATSDGSSRVPKGEMCVVVDADPSCVSAAALNSGGYAHIRLASLGLGSHSLEFQYAGDEIHEPATWSATVEVVPSTPSVTLTIPTIDGSEFDAVFGQPITVTARVRANGAGFNLAGTVTFTASTGEIVGTAVIGGGHDVSVDAVIAVGVGVGVGAEDLSIVASFESTDPGFTSAASPAVVVRVGVAETSTTLTVVDRSTVGEQVTFTAVVAGVAPSLAIPAGAVRFSGLNGAVLAVVQLDETGAATLTLDGLPHGMVVYSARFRPADSTQYQWSSDYRSHTVDRFTPTLSATSSSPAGIAYGESVAYTATVGGVATQGAPGGQVTFSGSFGTRIATIGASGTASVSVTFPVGTAGTETVNVTYAGDATYANRSISVAQPVTLATAEVSVSVSGFRPRLGEAQTATVSVSGFTAPQGTVTLRDGDIVVGTTALTTHVGAPISRAIFALPAAGQTAGEHVYTAHYAPTSNFLAATGTTTSTVERGHIDITAKSQPSLTSGTAVDVSATIRQYPAYTSFVPTGTVGFYEGATLLATAPVEATFSSARWTATAALELAPGVHNVEVRYLGDTNFNAASVYVRLVRAEPTRSLSLSGHSTANGRTTLAASITATHPWEVMSQAAPLTGVVQFIVDGTITADVDFVSTSTTHGSAVLEVPAYTLPFTAGRHTVTADFRRTPTSEIYLTATTVVTTRPAPLNLQIVAEQPVYGQPLDLQLAWDGAGPAPTGKFRITSGRRSCISNYGGTVWTSTGSTRVTPLPATDHCEMMFDNSNISFANGSWSVDVTATYLDPDVFLQRTDIWYAAETTTSTLTMERPTTILSATKSPAVTLSIDEELSVVLTARFPSTAPRPDDGYVFAPRRADGRFNLSVDGLAAGIATCTPIETLSTSVDMPTRTRVSAARSTCSVSIPAGFLKGRDQLAFTGTYTGDSTFQAADVFSQVPVTVTVCSALVIAPGNNGSGAATPDRFSGARCPDGRVRSGETFRLDTTPADGWVFAWWEEATTDCSTNPCTTIWTPRRNFSRHDGIAFVVVTDLDAEFRPVFAQDCVTVILANQYMVPTGWGDPRVTETRPLGGLSCVEHSEFGVLTEHSSYEPVSRSVSTVNFDQDANIWAPEELGNVGPTQGRVITTAGIVTHVPRGTELSLRTKATGGSVGLYGRTTVDELGYGNDDRCYGTTCPVLAVRRNAGAGKVGRSTFAWAPAADLGSKGAATWSITPTDDVTTMVSVYGPDCYNLDVNVSGGGRVQQATSANCRIGNDELFVDRSVVEVVVEPNDDAMTYVIAAECADDSVKLSVCSRVDNQATPTATYTSTISDRIGSDQTIDVTFTACTALTLDVRGLATAATHSPGNCPAEPKTPAQIAAIDAAAIKQRFFDQSGDFDFSMPTEPVVTVTGDATATVLYERGTNVFVSAQPDVSAQGGRVSWFVDWGNTQVTDADRFGATHVGSLVLDANALVSPSFYPFSPCHIEVYVTSHDGIAALDPGSDRPESQCDNHQLVYSDLDDFEARADRGGVGAFARPVNGQLTFNSYTNTNAIPGWTYIVKTIGEERGAEVTSIGTSVDVRVPRLPRVAEPIVRADGSVDPRMTVDVELEHCVVVRPDINLIGLDGVAMTRTADGTFNNAFLDTFQFTSTDVDPNCSFLPAQPAWALDQTVEFSATRSPGLNLISWGDGTGFKNSRGIYQVTLDGSSSVVDLPATFQVTCFTLDVAGAWPDEAPTDAWPSDPPPPSEDALFIGDVSPRPNCPGADPSEHRYIGGTPVTVQRMGLGRLERFMSWSGDVVDYLTMFAASVEFSAKNPGYELRDVGTKAAKYVDSVYVDPVEFAHFDATQSTTTVVMNQDRSVIANYRHTDGEETWKEIGEVAGGTLALAAKTLIENVPPFSAITMVMSLMNELGDPWNTASQSWDAALSPLSCTARSGLASNTERLPPLGNRIAAAPDQTTHTTLNDAQSVIDKVGARADKLGKKIKTRVNNPIDHYTPTGTKTSAAGGAEVYHWDENTSLQRTRTVGKIAKYAGNVADVVSFGLDVADLADADSISIEDCLSASVPDIAIIASCGLPQTGELRSDSEKDDFVTYLANIKSGQTNCPADIGVPAALTGMAAWDFVWTAMKCELLMPTSVAPDQAAVQSAAITAAQTNGCLIGF